MAPLKSGRRVLPPCSRRQTRDGRRGWCGAPRARACLARALLGNVAELLHARWHRPRDRWCAHGRADRVTAPIRALLIGSKAKSLTMNGDPAGTHRGHPLADRDPIRTGPDSQAPSRNPERHIAAIRSRIAIYSARDPTHKLPVAIQSGHIAAIRSRIAIYSARDPTHKLPVAIQSGHIAAIRSRIAIYGARDPTHKLRVAIQSGHIAAIRSRIAIYGARDPTHTRRVAIRSGQVAVLPARRL
jgi:hypothetical protein